MSLSAKTTLLHQSMQPNYLPEKIVSAIGVLAGLGISAYQGVQLYQVDSAKKENLWALGGFIALFGASTFFLARAFQHNYENVTELSAVSIQDGGDCVDPDQQKINQKIKQIVKMLTPDRSSSSSYSMEELSNSKEVLQNLGTIQDYLQEVDESIKKAKEENTFLLSEMGDLNQFIDEMQETLDSYEKEVESLQELIKKMQRQEHQTPENFEAIESRLAKLASHSHSSRSGSANASPYRTPINTSPTRKGTPKKLVFGTPKRGKQ